MQKKNIAEPFMPVWNTDLRQPGDGEGIGLMGMTVIEAVAGVAGYPKVEQALAFRADLVRASQANYEAVLTPRDPGGLSHRERLALAARIARLNDDPDLAGHYLDRLAGGGHATESTLADPGAPPPGDPRHAAILRHVDLVTRTPREATRQDIAALRARGIAEADIVRLSQLIAFVNYQVRVIAGLRLMGATQ
jgi:uncharacterized protein YciW